jgi:uncharacterized RDD family membrane protein YckC
VLTILWVLVVLRVLWFMSGLTGRFQPDPWGRAFVATVSFVALAIVYEAVFVSRSSGQTPGMDIVNVRVVGPGADGTVGAVRAVLRVLPVLVVPMVRPVWAAVALLAVFGLMLARPTRRSLVDSLTGTTVVPFDRDLEDPTARRPMARHRRRAMARDELLDGSLRSGTTGPATPRGDDVR